MLQDTEHCLPDNTTSLANPSLDTVEARSPVLPEDVKNSTFEGSRGKYVSTHFLSNFFFFWISFLYPK